MTDREVVTSKRQLTAAFDRLIKADAFTFDTETMHWASYGHPELDDRRGDPLRNDVVWISLASDDFGCTIPMGHPNGEYDHTEFPLLKSGEARAARGLPLRPQDYSKDERKAKKIFGPPPAQLELDVVMDRLEDLWFDNPAIKVAQNEKFDLKSLAKYYGGEIPDGPYFDTMLAAWLLDSRRGTPEVRDGLSLDVLVKNYLGVTMVKGVGKKIEDHSFDDVAEYSLLDSEDCHDLFRQLRQELKRDRLHKLMKLEMDVLAAVCRMELAGAPINTQVLDELHEKLEHDVEVAKGQVYKHAGRVFNINSVPEKQKILYSPKKDHGRGLRTAKRTASGGMPVDAATLEKFRGKDPMVDALLEYQELNKLLSTYVIPYKGGKVTRTTGGKERVIEKPSLLIDGRVHGTFKQNGAETGRFCVSPDTLIDMPRDMSLYPDGVPMRDVKVGDWVYAYDHHMRLTLRQVEWIGPTKTDRTVVVTFENSEGDRRTLTCTPDHLVRLYNGDWRPAEYLLRSSHGTPPRVLGMVRRGWKSRLGNDRYMQFFPNSNSRQTPPSVTEGQRYGSTSGGRNLEHRWVMEQTLGKKLSTKVEVNHIDGNKLNNHPSNLEYLSGSEHRAKSYVDGTRGKVQPDVEQFTGKTDWRAISIEEGPVMEVWDMTVPEDHCFIGNGLCLHNSSKDPNLQNIPNASTENGKILRSLFYAPDGYTMVICDYSQIEPRIIASLSGDPILHGAYDRGEDVYMAMATPLGMDRAAGKLAILAMSYGVGPEKIEEGLHLPPGEGKALLKKFEKTYKGVYSYKAKVIRQAANRKPTPYVETVLGRRRYLPGLRSTEWSEKGRAERQVFNALIQGCLPADARVLTRDGGWAPIGEFVDGTEVWTGENWAKAIKVDRGVDTRIRLHLSDGRTFDCDTRHKLLVNDGVWPRWATMDEIVGLPLVRDTQTVFGSPDGDPEDWYWLGRMIGDGHTASSNAKTKVWTLAFGPDEQEDVARFTSWLDGKDFRGKTNSKRGYSFNKAAGGWVSQVVGGTRKGFEHWVSRGVVGGSRGKRIPAKVFTLDKASRQAFFDGYFDADGHRTGRISKITSVNRPLLEDTLRLMQTLGMHGKLSSPMKNGRGVEWFDLYVHATPTELTVERVEYLDPEPMMTLSVFDEKHAFSSEGIISKNTAADIMKIALVKIDHALAEIPDAQLILTVHDEVVVLCRTEDTEEVAVAVQQAMESVRLPGIDIPLKADPDIGPNWASKH